MLKYTVKKILGMIPMLLIITFIIYWLLDLTPGDPTSYLMDPESLARLTNEQMAALRAQYGLDDPFVIRYFKWLFRSFLKARFPCFLLFNSPDSSSLFILSNLRFNLDCFDTFIPPIRSASPLGPEPPS